MRHNLGGRVLPCLLVLRKIRFALPKAVDDARIHAGQAARRLGGEPEVGRFRRGDEDVRGLSDLPC